MGKFLTSAALAALGALLLVSCGGAETEKNAIREFIRAKSAAGTAVGDVKVLGSGSVNGRRYLKASVVIRRERLMAEEKVLYAFFSGGAVSGAFDSYGAMLLDAKLAGLAGAKSVKVYYRDRHVEELAGPEAVRKVLEELRGSPDYSEELSRCPFDLRLEFNAAAGPVSVLVGVDGCGQFYMKGIQCQGTFAARGVIEKLVEKYALKRRP